MPLQTDAGRILSLGLFACMYISGGKLDCKSDSIKMYRDEKKKH